VAGFSFTKLDATTGEALSKDTIGHGCVKDNVTGLVWEVKNDKPKGTDIHSGKNTYRWGGVTAKGIDRPDSDKKGSYYDDWDTLVEGSNENALCGFRDWHIPDREELRSIANLGSTTGAAIDKYYFPYTQSRFYWSSISTNKVNAKILNLYNGTGGNGGRGDGNYVRLVSDGQ
jgi:hypothetical protein